MKHLKHIVVISLILTTIVDAEAKRNSYYITNHPPLAEKPYSELPLGAIEPRGWLRNQLECMASGMTGQLDKLYPQVLGPRNGWLGGDGDGWERGPYWIDGLLPLGHLLKDQRLIEKANRWIEWSLSNQREDGYLGPIPFDKPPQPEPGLQRDKRQDWWPKMVMLKVLQQHYMATGDERVIAALTKYFRYQLQELPKTPLGHWSYWGNRRGADNLVVVLWLYNVTHEPFLLELAELVHSQTYPYTKAFLERGDIELEGPENQLKRTSSGAMVHPFHCVNLAQGMKAPIVYSQLNPNPEHLQSVRKAFHDLDKFHGQPHGLFGGDEPLHGRELTRGSELCTAVEMMYSLETMLEITGEVEFADRLESIAYNVLPSQVSDDCLTRQYFQQANQVMVTHGSREFFHNEPDRLVFGLLSGYPCCTCNLHQGWPKFAQHLWMASSDNGLAALLYGPSTVRAKVGDQGTQVTIEESTDYPFRDSVRFRVQEILGEETVRFPLHVRIPGWCSLAEIRVNGVLLSQSQGGQISIVERAWHVGDILEVTLPMQLKVTRWHNNSASIQLGPLVFGLRIDEEWSLVNGNSEVRPLSPWNYALLEDSLKDPSQGFEIVEKDLTTASPWTLSTAPLEIHTSGIRLPKWKISNGTAGQVPKSPQPRPTGATTDPITLVPYGCTTLRISGFPTVD